MPMTEDMDVFFSTDEFAHQAVLNGRALMGIFTDAFERLDVGAIGMSSVQPALTVPTADVPDLVEGLPLEVAGKRYTVAEHQPDGTGVSLLLLERVA